MSARLKNNLELFKVLVKLKPNNRKVILKYVTDDVITCLCELVDNVLKGNVELKPRHRRMLIKYKRVLREIAKKSKPMNQKRKIFVQKGGLLGTLLTLGTALIPTIINLFKKI